LRASSERIGGRRIFNSPALLQHQRAQPTIFALIVLVLKTDCLKTSFWNIVRLFAITHNHPILLKRLSARIVLTL
jgi:hypothetical protein